MLENAVLGFEFGNAGFEIRLAFFGGVEHGVVIASLLSSLIEQRPIGTIRARKRRKRLKEARGCFRRLARWDSS